MPDEDPFITIIAALSVIQTTLNEILRRIPEPRCGYCGLTYGNHALGADHEFVAYH